MFFSFGKKVPNTKRRGYQCEVLEPSEMIAVSFMLIMFFVSFFYDAFVSAEVYLIFFFDSRRKKQN